MTDTLHVTCPHCDTANRVPAARLSQHPNCGQCKKGLFTGHPIALTSGNFDRHAGGDLPLVVDFWTAWCGPCRAMAPAFEQAAAQAEPQARLGKLDTEAAPDIAARFGIRSIPTLIIFKQGREIARRSGAMDAKSLTAWIQANR